MRLPIPILYQGAEYNEVELIRPRSKVMADASEKADNNPYLAFKALISGCVGSFGGEDTVTERSQIMAMVNDMPFASAEFVMTQIAILYRGSDKVEGKYKCPARGCDGVIESVMDKENDIDFRDSLNALPVIERSLDPVEITLKYPFEAKNKKNDEDRLTIESLKFRVPLLRDAIKAYVATGGRNEVRLTDAIWSECLLEINGVTKEEDSLVRSLASYVLQNKDVADAKEIARRMGGVGIDNQVEKTCSKCGETFMATIDTRSFFVEAMAG